MKYLVMNLDSSGEYYAASTLVTIDEANSHIKNWDLENPFIISQEDANRISDRRQKLKDKYLKDVDKIWKNAHKDANSIKEVKEA